MLRLNIKLKDQHAMSGAYSVLQAFLTQDKDCKWMGYTLKDGTAWEVRRNKGGSLTIRQSESSTSP